MKIELTIPKSVRGKTEMLDALNAVKASKEARVVLHPILEIVKRALSPGIQQEFFANFERHVNDPNLPQQASGNVKLKLDLSDTDLEAVRGELIDVAMAGSEWIWKNASDGQAAAIFEVICDILEEGLAPLDQQALLDGNMADLAG